MRMTSAHALFTVVIAAASSVSVAAYAESKIGANPEGTRSSASSVTDTLQGDLLITSLNGYCVDANWSECLSGYFRGQMNPVQDALGEWRIDVAAREIADLHFRVLSGLERRFRLGKLGRLHWGERFQLEVTVHAVDFWYHRDDRGLGEQPVGQVQTGMKLKRFPEGDTVFELKPPLAIHKRIPEGATLRMEDLVTETVDSLYSVLSRLEGLPSPE